MTHVHETSTRNLHKFLASNVAARSYKFLYKLARNRAAFYSVQETRTRNKYDCTMDPERVCPTVVTAGCYNSCVMLQLLRALKSYAVQSLHANLFYL